MADQSSHSGGSRPARGEDKALVMAPLQGLLLALLAGLVIWGALEIMMPLFQLPEHLRNLSGNVPDAQLQELREAMPVVAAKNATLSLVLMAFTLGSVLAVAEQLFRRDPLRAVWGGLLAGLVAAAIAVGAGAIGAAVIGSLELPDHRLVKTVIVQSAMWSLTGLGVGLGISLPLFRLRLLVTCVAGCLLGGLLAALLFPVTVGALLPHVNTEFLMPEPGIGRLLWVGFPAGLIGLTVTGLGKQKRKRLPGP